MISIHLTYDMAAMMGMGYGLVLVSSVARVFKVGDSNLEKLII